MKPPSLYSAEGWNSIIGVELLSSLSIESFPYILVKFRFRLCQSIQNLYRRSTIIATLPRIFFSMVYSLAKKKKEKGSLENVLSHGLGTIRSGLW